MKYQLLLSLSIMFFLIACGGDDTDDCSTSATTELSGTILDRPFDFQTARALFDADEDEFQIQMFADDDIVITDVCASIGTMLIGSQITFFIDNSTGSQNFGGTRIVTLFHAATMEFVTTTSGCYSVDSITDTTVSGKLTLLNSDDTTMVTGTWSAKICG